MSEITVTVSGPVGSGKSAICGEIEIALRAIGVTVKWDDEGEKSMTGADWQGALDLYQPTVTIRETNTHIERKRVCEAAMLANHNFRQWMPQGWIDRFLDRYLPKDPSR